MSESTTSRKHIMTIAMGAMALITLATTVIIGKHYWDMLSGVFVVAIVGLALPDWVAWWCSYLHAKATKEGNEDPRVAHTSLVVSGALSLVMILNAGAVLAVWWDDQQLDKAVKRTTETSTTLQNARNAGTTSAIEARGRVIQQMKASGATERTIRDYLRAEAERDKTVALTTAPKQNEAVAEGYIPQVPEPVQKYMSFWVYIIPALAGLVGLFALIISVKLPGGLEFSKGATVKQTGFAQAAPAIAKTGNTTISTGNLVDPAGK